MRRTDRRFPVLLSVAGPLLALCTAAMAATGPRVPPPPVPLEGGVAAVGAGIPAHTDGPANGVNPIPIGKGTITVSGKLFYNDLRETGHFDWRRDSTGKLGAAATSTTNDLGAWMVVADFYELDPIQWDLWHCQKETYLGSDTIDSYGSYSFSFNVTDSCSAEPDTVPDIGVRFRLRFCNSDITCFSMRDDAKYTYQLWHPHANPTTTLKGTAGTHTLSTFEYKLTDGDDYAKAANNYAYLADAMEVWHVENVVPFEPHGEGEVFVDYPSTEANDHGTAFTDNDHQIYLRSAWSYESTVWHEYGHILNMRAWDDTTGTCGDCPGGDSGRTKPGWSGTELEYPHEGLKEGWAEFAKMAVEYWPVSSCGSFDDNESTDVNDWICSADPDEYPNDLHRVTYPNDGKSYVRDVKKLLCDWWDARAYDDDDSNMAGDGDEFEASLYSVWYNLDEMWDWVPSRTGLTICDYTDYYLEGRKSVANVGQDSHDDYVGWIGNLAYNNGIQCDLSPNFVGGSSGADEGQDAEDKVQDKLDKLKDHYDEYGPK